jgi:ParB/RepB/Spo0J family partition protein
VAKKAAAEKFNVKLVERTSLPIKDVHPNVWNPNVQDPEMFRLLAQSLKEEGFGEPVLVRPCPDHDDYEIVNGEHRYQLAVETELTHIPVAVVAMNTTDAKLATVRRNKTRGGLDTLKTAALLRDMRRRMSDDEIELRLGYNEHELSELMMMLDQPFVPFAHGKGNSQEQFELSMDPGTARWLDDALMVMAGKREKRFEGKPSRKARGLVKGLSLCESV